MLIQYAWKSSLLLKQLYCYYRNIHMYDFYGDAEHHHRSQCKYWAAFKKAGPKLGLGTSGHSWKLLGILGKLYF